MLDAGRMLFLANYVYTYSFYARTMMIFFIGLLLQSIWTSNSKSTPMNLALGRAVWKMSAVGLTRLQ